MERVGERCFPGERSFFSADGGGKEGGGGGT